MKKPLLNHIYRKISFLAAMMAVSFTMTGSVFAQGAAGSQQLDISGELDVVIIEDFDRQHSEKAYFIREANSNRVFELKFDRRPPQHLKTGKRIRARGQGQGRNLWVESLEEGANDSSAVGNGGGDAALGTEERRAVVLIVDLEDASASSQYSPEQVASNMWTGSRSVDGLFLDASHGQLGFLPDSDNDAQPDVFGPFSINQSKTGCDYYGWAQAAEEAAVNQGIDLSLYQHRVFVLPRYNDLPDCSWSGIANVGCGTFCRAWIAEGESPMVYAHELGHNLNMAHAGTDPENDSQINSTYGDYSDPMGLSRKWHRFNAAHADQLGWYDAYAGSVITVVADGIYDVAAIGLDPELTGMPHILKIAKPDSNDFYYLSYRQPSGYDDSLSTTYTQGTNVHRYKGDGYGYTSFITAINDLEYFDDAPNGISISQLGHNADHATLEIAFADGGGNGGSCTSADPTVTITPTNLLVSAGTVINYTVSVANLDDTNCASTDFQLAYSIQPGGPISSSSVTSAPGETVSTGLQFDTSGLGDGEYVIKVDVSDEDGLEPYHENTVSRSATLRVDATPPTTPTGLSGTVDKKGKASLNWQSATDATSGVQSYKVFRDSALIGQTSGTSLQDSNTTAGATHVYTVVAVDNLGLESTPCNGLQLTVSNSTGKGSGGGGGANGGGGKGKNAR